MTEPKELEGPRNKRLAVRKVPRDLKGVAEKTCKDKGCKCLEPRPVFAACEVLQHPLGKQPRKPNGSRGRHWTVLRQPHSLSADSNASEKEIRAVTVMHNMEDTRHPQLQPSKRQVTRTGIAKGTGTGW